MIPNKQQGFEGSIKSLQATRDGRSSSEFAVDIARPAWLSSGHQTAMRYPVKLFIRSRRAISGSFLFSVLLAILQPSAFAGGSVTLTWSPSTDPLVVGYNIYYGGASGTYTNSISVGSAISVTISGLIPGASYYFAATTYNADNLESPLSGEESFLAPLDVPIMISSNAYTVVLTTNAPGFYTNRLHKISPIPPFTTNQIVIGFWICSPTSGMWTLQSSSNLLTWFDYATSTNAVFIPYTSGNCYFRYKSP